jgi:MYXO-CTERM domain-containing protein
VSALLLLLALGAQAQDYSFPTSAEDYGHFYVTAYYDHHGVDWNCGGYQYSGHRGNDYGVGSWEGMDAGRDLVAAADGTVIYANDGEYDRCDSGDCSGGSGFGNYVKLQHADGKYTYYAHMRQWTVTVSAGDWVACGTKLGEVGSSGYSTGPHLHFEVRESSGSQSDPFDGSCSFPPSYWVAQGGYMGVPGRACESGEPCEPAATLRCGDRIDASNAGSGSSDEHAYYGCSEWSYSGPEMVYSFSTAISEPVSLSLSGHSADLDIYVLGSTACDGSDCLAYSDNSETEAESLSFDASAGQDYVIVVDGWEDAVSSFHLEVGCDGGEEPVETDEPDPGDSEPPGDSEAPDPGDSDDGDPGSPPGSRAENAPTGGCGCAAGERGSGWWLLGILGLLGRRRRE